MTNAYTIEGSLRRARITHLINPTRIIKFKFGKQWSTLSFGAVALEKVKMRMNGHSRGQASAELGENPQSRYCTTFLMPTQGSSLGRLSNDKRRMVFWSRTTSKREQHLRP